MTYLSSLGRTHAGCTWDVSSTGFRLLTAALLLSACTLPDVSVLPRDPGQARDAGNKPVDDAQVRDSATLDGNIGDRADGTKKDPDTSGERERDAGLDGSTKDEPAAGTAGSVRKAAGAAGSKAAPDSGVAEPDCMDGFGRVGDRCVPMNDECQRDNPCSPNANCEDPSVSEGDVTCTCKRGFSGNGVDCVASCSNDPCGMGGTCTVESEASYRCTCPPGTREAGGKCGCDLSGTFGVLTTQHISWKDVDQFLEDGDVQTSGFSLHRHTYGQKGELRVEIQDCGSTVYDLCSVPFPPFLGAEAYGQWVPNSVWDLPTMPRTMFAFSQLDSQPGAAFKTPAIALLNGIKLDDPMGEWPASYQHIAGAPGSGSSPVNGATWSDPDNDGSIGLTMFNVGPGGEPLDGVAPEPPMAYGSHSMECPRRNDGDRAPYAYPPAMPNGSLAVQRIKRVFSAQRMTLAYEGKIDSCDALSGSVTGPADGKPRVEQRVGGCVRVNGDNESACSTTTFELLDQQQSSQALVEAKFKMKRLSSSATCREVVGATFD